MAERPIAATPLGLRSFLSLSLSLPFVSRRLSGTYIAQARREKRGCVCLSLCAHGVRVWFRALLLVSRISPPGASEPSFAVRRRGRLLTYKVRMKRCGAHMRVLSSTHCAVPFAGTPNIPACPSLLIIVRRCPFHVPSPTFPPLLCSSDWSHLKHVRRHHLGSPARCFTLGGRTRRSVHQRRRTIEPTSLTLKQNQDAVPSPHSDDSRSSVTDKERNHDAAPLLSADGLRQAFRRRKILIVAAIT